MTKQKNEPEITFGEGTLKTTTFINEKDGKQYRKIQISKSYLKEGKWEQQKISINTRDLLNLAFYLQLSAKHNQENPLIKEITPEEANEGE